jgi:hypothetical protein
MMHEREHEWWREGRPDLRWRTIGNSAGQHSLQTQVRLQDADPPRTWPHLNGVGPGVEVGGSQTLGCRGVGGATPTAATATTIVFIAVILLFAGQMQLLLLLLSWWAFLPAGRGRR